MADELENTAAADDAATTTADDAAENLAAVTDNGDGGEDTSKEAGGEADDKASATLESYADLKMMEGFELDEAAMEEALPVLKDLGATKEQAQKLTDVVSGMIQAGEQKKADDFSQLVNDWRDSSLNDKEFGGEKFEENAKIAQQAIEKFGTPGLKQVLTESGLGNHPDVIRFALNIGRQLREDNPGQGSATTKESSRLDILYPQSTN